MSPGLGFKALHEFCDSYRHFGVFRGAVTPGSPAFYAFRRGHRSNTSLMPLAQACPRAGGERQMPGLVPIQSRWPLIIDLSGFAYFRRREGWRLPPCRLPAGTRGFAAVRCSPFASASPSSDLEAAARASRTFGYLTAAPSSRAAPVPSVVPNATLAPHHHPERRVHSEVSSRASPLFPLSSRAQRSAAEGSAIGCGATGVARFTAKERRHSLHFALSF
jgi:hypothetical protein